MKMHEGIAPIMKRSRAFVAPYVELESGDKDGIPTAMLEALATGLPIVTTDAGSILEIVQHGVQALISPQRNSLAYTEALDKLITDPSLERKLAKEARKRFDEAFDIKVTERRLHERVAAALQPAPVAQ
jgi:glycosyltransferase involved in cell wall biosynthesis